jgi:hypothetical protein
MRYLLRVAAALLALLALVACNLSNQPQPTPTPTPSLPTVQFLAPANNAQIPEGTDVDIDIVASDAGIGIGRVELLVDDQKINERGPDVSAAVPVFTVRMNWLARVVGRHTLTAIAYRPDGTPSDPVVIIVDVIPAATAEATP